MTSTTTRLVKALFLLGGCAAVFSCGTDDSSPKGGAGAGAAGSAQAGRSGSSSGGRAGAGGTSGASTANGAGKGGRPASAGAGEGGNTAEAGSGASAGESGSAGNGGNGGIGESGSAGQVGAGGDGGLGACVSGAACDDTDCTVLDSASIDALSADVVPFGTDESFNRGCYRVDYLEGAHLHTTTKYSTDTYVYSDDVKVGRLGVYNQASAEAAESGTAGAHVAFIHCAGSIGVGSGDTAFGDNSNGTPNPTWQLSFCGRQ